MVVLGRLKKDLLPTAAAATTAAGTLLSAATTAAGTLRSAGALAPCAGAGAHGEDNGPVRVKSQVT